MKNAGLLNGAQFYKTNTTITGANSEVFGVKKIMKKKLRFYTKNNSFFDIDHFYIIEGLSPDVNISKTAMAALGIKWNFQDEHVIINKEKVPLVSSSVFNVHLCGSDINFRNHHLMATRD